MNGSPFDTRSVRQAQRTLITLSSSKDDRQHAQHD
jgi:hypothetical protein